MHNSTVFDATLLQLPIVHNENGSITAVNQFREIPFEIKRVYYLYDVPGGTSRGGHGHKELQQLIIAASGSFDITLFDGKVRRTFQLNRPYMGLYMPSGLWRDIDNFSSGAICLVLASLNYDEQDYLRDLTKFISWKES